VTPVERLSGGRRTRLVGIEIGKRDKRQPSPVPRPMTMAGAANGGEVLHAALALHQESGRRRSIDSCKGLLSEPSGMSSKPRSMRQALVIDPSYSPDDMRDQVAVGIDRRLLAPNWKHRHAKSIDLELLGSSFR